MLPPPQPEQAPPLRDGIWDQVSETDRASWYLDPLVAAQKRQANASLLGPANKLVNIALKTDAFEEAFGKDSPLADLQPHARHWLLIDTAEKMVQRARTRMKAHSAHFLATDIRNTGLRSESIDLVFSNSTLDHFNSRGDFDLSIQELARITKPGGRLVITIDNPLNPTYWLLRAYCATSHAPFPLGYCPTPARLRWLLVNSGFEIRESGFLLHNPRLISTALFLGLRRVLGSNADSSVAALIKLFALLDKLPTRAYTACFYSFDAVRK